MKVKDLLAALQKLTAEQQELPVYLYDGLEELFRIGHS